MKILMVCDFYPPTMGGVETHVASLSRELVKRGHKVTVCTIWHKHSPKFEEDNGVRVNRFEGIFQKIPLLFKDPQKRYHPPLQDWLLTKELKNLIEKERPDIIHVHSWALYSVIPLRKKFNIPIVMTLHDFSLICPKKSLLKPNYALCDEPFTSKCIRCGETEYAPLKSLLAYQEVKLNRDRLKFVDMFIAVSSFAKEILSKHLILSNKKIVVIPNFCSEDEMKSSNKLNDAAQFPEDFILFVGRSSPIKGMDLLIEASRRAKSKPNLVLIVASGADCHDGTMGKNITLIKNAPHEIVKDAYRKCKLVVIPSLGPETFCIVSIEAMSCKKPVIASDIGGLKEIIIHGETGILVPRGDTKRLVRAVDQLLKNPILAEKLGEKGFRRFLQNYESKVVVPRVERIYAKLLQRSCRKVVD
jgi:glycosyltransferase involved in cell wall biosynthesis